MVWSEIISPQPFPINSTRSFDSAQPNSNGKSAFPFASLRMTDRKARIFAMVSRIPPGLKCGVGVNTP